MYCVALCGVSFTKLSKLVMWKSLVLSVLCVSSAWSQVIDLETEEAVEGTFLESGFITLSAYESVNISTFSAFTFPVVFLSTPFAPTGYTDEVPVQPRVVSLVDNEGAEEVVTFSIELVWPSNRTCVSEWNDGSAPQGSYTVAWYVGETGGYSVSGVQMEFATSTVTAFQWNLANWKHSFGTECHYPTEEGDDDHSPGAIITLQSDNNAGQYLNVRTTNWFKNEETECDYSWHGGHMRMFPHDYTAADGLIDLNDIQDEKVGIFLFDLRYPRTLDCVANTYIEIGMTTALTSDKEHLKTYATIDTSVTSVGVFGSIVSFEGGDSMMIKSYSLSSHVKKIYSFIQEDKCVDEEIVHWPETFTYLIVTPSSNDQCNLVSDPILGDFSFAPTSRPTSSPSLMPSTASPTRSPTLGEDLVVEAGRSQSDEGGILLAVFLPICIIIVVAVVGLVTKKVFLGAPPADSSEHSGLNLMANP